jgi:hypothetical protein
MKFNFLTMNKVFLIILVLLQLDSFSQEKNAHNYYWSNEENQRAIVGVNNCYVRENPSTKATLLDSLQIGKEITVVKSTDIDYAINGVNVSWVAIEYQNKSGTISKGFLWKGFIALGYVKKKDLTFLTTIDKFENRKSDGMDVFSISTKVLSNQNVVLGQKTFQETLGESAYFQNNTIGGFGLKNVSHIYRISFEGEACGIPSLFFYFAWNGTKIIQLPGKFGAADADIYFHNEDFIFPKEKGGKPNTIIKFFKEGETRDEEAKRPTYTVKEWKEIYKWNGKKTILIEKTKLKKYKIKY